MSTPCNITVRDDTGKEIVIVYKHTDGYPDGPAGMIAELQKFIREIRNHSTHGPRLNDAELVASRLVVYLAREYQYSDVSTNFLSLYIVPERDWDYYQYEIHCEQNDWARIVGPLRR